MSAQVLAVNVGRPSTGPWTGRVGRTGIDKRPVTGPVAVRRLGLDGDSVCDRRYHAGPDHAVHAFAREDLDHWQSELGRPIRDGQFGENLTTQGLDVTAALIGERWRVGSALLEVAKVRTACRVFAGWMARQGLDDAGWVKRFTAHGRPGAYLRVLEEGVVERGDPVVVEHRPDHEVTVGVMFAAFTTERHLLPALLVVDDLTEEAMARMRRHLGMA